jgi:asparagine synthase (glutamine-hydrolysing)
MCGITGIVRLREGSPIEQNVLEPMAAELVHRGPDDQGFHLDEQGRCGLAFRRLAIVDLQTGNQPLGTADGRYTVVFNGEIYNFRELRDELARQGCQFRTQGDAEVVVYAFATWGTDCFRRFNGMFAIGIWDSQRGELTLARDRFGKKPLYYARLPDRLIFASEIKAIIANGDVPRRIDPQALHAYLLWMYIPPGDCIYRDFAQVPPGCLLTVRNGDVSGPSQYWEVPSPEPFRGTYTEALEQLDTHLRRAVQRRLISDVPLGAFLSGGVDSSAVVALMRELNVSPLRTFSIGFDDARYDETHFARLVAKRHQTEHHAFTVTPEAESILDTLAYHYDEPFADSSAIPTYYVSQQTRDSVTVALTGDAGDEAFGGYDRYRAMVVSGALDALPGFVRHGLARLAGLLPHGQAKSLSRRVYRFLSALRLDPGRRYLEWMSTFSPQMLGQGYTAQFAQKLEFERPMEAFVKLFELGSAAHPDDALAMATDYQSYLPGDLLTKVDRVSMAVSLECRSPFLDPELVEFALSLPIRWRRQKRILKDWARDRLPDQVLDRPKMGFGVPIGEWFRGPLAQRCEGQLLASGGFCTQIFQRDWLEQLITEHQTQRANHEHRLWALMMLELWHERWKPSWD